MATFMSLHKKLNFCGIAFDNGMFQTEDPKVIELLSSPLAKEHDVMRIDSVEEKKEPEKAPAKKSVKKK